MTTQRKRQALHGWLILDKPLGLSSTQALSKVRWLLNANKAGHGGTLDPLASGVLPIAFGEATKTIQWAMDGTKTYLFTVKWGSETTTDDLEGEVAVATGLGAVQHDIESILPDFHGALQQVPPIYSAIKVDGERAYDLARAGEAVELTSRIVNIDSLSIEKYISDSETLFRVTCGKGTYVRSLARDMGRKLGCLGHVITLRRVQVGPFLETQAISLEKLEKIVHSPPSENSLSDILRPITTVLDGIPALALMETEVRRLQQGQRVLLPETPEFSHVVSEAEAVLVTSAEKPIGMFRIENRVLKTIRLFNL
jgi:tRNA pseudouridine55 synthase